MTRFLSKHTKHTMLAQNHARFSRKHMCSGRLESAKAIITNPQIPNPSTNRHQFGGHRRSSVRVCRHFHANERYRIWPDRPGRAGPSRKCPALSVYRALVIHEGFISGRCPEGVASAHAPGLMLACERRQKNDINKQSAPRPDP